MCRHLKAAGRGLGDTLMVQRRRSRFESGRPSPSRHMPLSKPFAERYRFQNISTAFIRRLLSVVT